jgi:clan AA aspartic protease
LIAGTVKTDLEAVVSISVHGPDNSRLEVEATIDTGFNGYLTLPRNVISELGLQSNMRHEVVLGDGSQQFVDVFDGLVELGGETVAALVESAEIQPLVGMALMRGYGLQIEVVRGGTVRLEPL